MESEGKQAQGKVGSKVQQPVFSGFYLMTKQFLEDGRAHVQPRLPLWSLHYVELSTTMDLLGANIHWLVFSRACPFPPGKSAWKVPRYAEFLPRDYPRRTSPHRGLRSLLVAPTEISPSIFLGRITQEGFIEQNRICYVCIQTTGAFMLCLRLFCPCLPPLSHLLHEIPFRFDPFH